MERLLSGYISLLLGLALTPCYFYRIKISLMKTTVLIGGSAILSGITALVSGKFEPAYALVIFGIWLIVLSYLLDIEKRGRKSQGGEFTDAN